jgi:hypothetical protein
MTRKDEPMKKQMLAGLMSASLVLGGVTATPVRADNNDLAKALFGIAAIAIIGTAIHNNRATTRVTPPPAPTPPAPRPGHIPARARILPSSCLVDYDTGWGQGLLLGSECLSRNYRYAHLLPQQCEVDVRLRRRAFSGFDPSCLRYEGFRLDYNY